MSCGGQRDWLGLQVKEAICSAIIIISIPTEKTKPFKHTCLFFPLKYLFLYKNEEVHYNSVKFQRAERKKKPVVLILKAKNDLFFFFYFLFFNLFPLFSSWNPVRSILMPNEWWTPFPRSKCLSGILGALSFTRDAATCFKRREYNSCPACPHPTPGFPTTGDKEQGHKHSFKTPSFAKYLQIYHLQEALRLIQEGLVCIK